jgi:hypothetical protein
MSRRFTALKPQLNRIRAWAHEGSTDAWIAHQLETTADAVLAFRQEHGIERGGPAPLAPITPDSVVEAMLAEEEAAAAAAELGFEPVASEPEPEPESERKPARAPRTRSRQRAAKPEADAPEAAPAEDGAVAEEPAVAEAPARSSRGRGSRGGASRRSTTAAAAEGPDEQPVAEAEEAEEALPVGEDEPARTASSRKRGRRRGRGRGAGRGLEARFLPGSVLLLDPSVAADPSFQEHWQDAGPLRVEIGADAIILRRVTADAEPDHSQGI